MHGEVLTAADNPSEFDGTVLGETPNDYQYGYCADCQAKFRWSAVSQRWVRWPGPTGQLPLLTDEELEGLYICATVYVDAMPEVMFPATQAAIGRRTTVLRSLLTAIAETRQTIERTI